MHMWYPYRYTLSLSIWLYLILTGVDNEMYAYHCHCQYRCPPVTKRRKWKKISPLLAPHMLKIKDVCFEMTRIPWKTSRLWIATLTVLLSEAAAFSPIVLKSPGRFFDLGLANDDDSSGQKIDEFQYASQDDPLWRQRSECWVIVVDDEEGIRRAVGQLLFDRGYQVTTCADGATALDVSRSKTDNGGNPKLPDCFVSDIRMPGMDGLELLERIRGEEILREIPVVLLTAKGMTKDRIAGYNAGADAYLPKPFDPDELVAIVDGVIERHENLNGANIQVEDLKRDLDEIKYLLLEKGGGGIGGGFVQQTNIFLAPDEREVLEHLCAGLMTKEIAAKTYFSTRRVEQLLTRMFRKTGAKNRTELVRWAVKTGNVQL